jgi:DNA-binding transcriptional regulator YiaG
MGRTAQRTAGRKMTPAQLRAARALLAWKQTDLAEASGVFVNTIKAYESGASDPKKSTELALMRALRKAGVVFIDGDEHHGPGVRLREPMR